MDKKNTMLLTVIAVATLLVAVVGATFAYFTASASGSSTTTVTATTESVAAVTLANEVPSLHANLSAADFAQTESAYKSYYATDGESDYETTETLKNILKASTTDSAAKYTCTAKVLVSYSGATLQEGDAFIKFGGQLASVGEVDLTKVSSTGYDVTFNLDGATTPAQYVSAAVRFVNKNTEQNHLAGQTINVTIKTDTTEANAFKCTVVQ